ncbi:hypothetical protein ACFSO7_03025 [Bacillus sp. CGMCC 1.16607]|uniref:hypothetical protein n=1 Tax=Bacillus sp. CGMCC 1.16607 TaxID=3351842 RepID=UPI0036288594
MIEGKGLGGKKINRVNVSLSNFQNQKLNKLATACNMRPTSLACLLIEKCLNNAQVVADLQKEYAIHSAYKVVPINHNGELQYILSERC